MHAEDIAQSFTPVCEPAASHEGHRVVTCNEWGTGYVIQDCAETGDQCMTGECVPSVCGDALVGPDEDCDDGNQIDGDACSNECTTALCGDGRVSAGESCDGEPGCTDECVWFSQCGNGITEYGEECDDGNGDEHDSCNNRCQSLLTDDALRGVIVESTSSRFGSIDSMRSTHVRRR